MVFLPGSVGKVPSGLLDTGPRIKESFAEDGETPGFEDYPGRKLAPSGSQLAIIALAVVFAIAVVLYFLRISQHQVLEIIVVASMDSLAFIFFGLIFDSFPIVNRNKLEMIVLSLLVLVPVDYVFLVYIINNIKILATLP